MLANQAYSTSASCTDRYTHSRAVSMHLCMKLWRHCVCQLLSINDHSKLSLLPVSHSANVHSSYRTHSHICTVLTKLTTIFHVNSDEPVFLFDFLSPFVPNPGMFSGCDREQSVQGQATVVDHNQLFSSQGRGHSSMPLSDTAKSSSGDPSVLPPSLDRRFLLQ